LVTEKRNLMAWTFAIYTDLGNSLSWWVLFHAMVMHEKNKSSFCQNWKS
jgi:hypothetical protein